MKFLCLHLLIGDAISNCDVTHAPPADWPRRRWCQYWRSTQILKSFFPLRWTWKSLLGDISTGLSIATMQILQQFWARRFGNNNKKLLKLFGNCPSQGTASRHHEKDHVIFYCRCRKILHLTKIHAIERLIKNAKFFCDSEEFLFEFVVNNIQQSIAESRIPRLGRHEKYRSLLKNIFEKSNPLVWLECFLGLFAKNVQSCQLKKDK